MNRAAVVAVHPTLGEMRVGCCVVFQHGTNRIIGRICNGSDELIQFQFFWTPSDLLLKMPIEVQPSGRSMASFASNELILGTRIHSLPLNSVQERIQVASYDNVSESAYFYRQVVDDQSSWSMEPHITPNVIQSDGTRTVENPETVYHYCACQGDRVLYPIEGEYHERKSVGDVESGYVLFTCSSCVSPPTIERTGGLMWLQEPDPFMMPDDSKRCTVIEKFYNGLSRGLEETASQAAFDEPNVVKRFCVALEMVIHDLYLDKPKEYKARAFTLSFNLSDAKNSSLRRRILHGQFSPKELAAASSEELASEDLQEKRKEQRDKYFHTHVRKREDLETAEDPTKKVKVDVPVETVGTPSVSHEVIATALPKERECLKTSVHQPAEIVQIRTADQSVKGFVDFADNLKSTLGKLKSESLRNHSISIVDYYIRHIHQ